MTTDTAIQNLTATDTQTKSDTVTDTETLPEPETDTETETDTLPDTEALTDSEAEPTTTQITPAITWSLTALIWAAVVLARESIAISAARVWTFFRERFDRSEGADAGMSTVEYAVGTIAAAAFGAVLYTVVSGDSIPDALGGIIERALTTSV